jgi:hypothetical protein
VFGGGELSEGDSKVVGIVEGIEEVLVCKNQYLSLENGINRLTEWVNVL